MDEDRLAKALAALDASLAELADTWDRLGDALAQTSLRAVEHLEEFQHALMAVTSQGCDPCPQLKKSRSLNAG